MESIVFDSGVRAFQINDGGVLRFNPADPNLYARFQKAQEKLTDLAESPCREGDTALQLLETADRELKDILNWVFGPDNDLDQILGGINLLAVAGNGKPVAMNLLAALEPVLLEGLERCVRQHSEAAAERANRRREEA